MPFDLSGSGRNQKDVVQLISQFGRVLKRTFISDKSKKAAERAAQSTAHNSTFGEVYANDLAKVEIEKVNPKFPLGAIIVREKNLTIASDAPETVIAMVKREKGFSTETGDWEFLVFSGSDLKLQSRETKSDCSKCHIQAQKSDWVFRDYLEVK